MERRLAGENSSPELPLIPAWDIVFVVLFFPLSGLDRALQGPETALPQLPLVLGFYELPCQPGTFKKGFQF